MRLRSGITLVSIGWVLAPRRAPHLDKGLPPLPVTWTVVQKCFHESVVSTGGRRFYIVDHIPFRSRQERSGIPAQAGNAVLRTLGRWWSASWSFLRVSSSSAPVTSIRGGRTRAHPVPVSCCTCLMS